MIDRSTPPAIIDAVDFELQLKACKKLTLTNGAPVYIVDAGAEQVISVEWVFYAGNSFENKNLVAATTNFLLKSGTHNKTAYQINELIDFYGAYLSTHCYNETATITLHCLNKYVATLFPLVNEILRDSIFPEDELALYKQNMKQRLEVNLKKSDFVAGRLIDVYLYGEKHPYGKYSKPEYFNALTQADITAFYNNYYRNGHFNIFIAGKIPNGIEEQLEQYFGTLPFSPKPHISHNITPASEFKARINNDPNGVQGSIRIARPFPNRHHPHFIKAMVLNTVLGGFFGSRLMANIREDKGYTYGIHSYLQNHLQRSAWVISTEAGKDVSEATIQEVYKEMEILRTQPIDHEELLLVKNYMMGSILGDLDGPFQIIGRWKNLILHGLTEEYFYHTIETIKTVTPQDLQALSQEYLNPKDFYELVVV